MGFIFKKKETNMPFYDYKDVRNFIMDKTGLDLETVHHVLAAEELYLTKIGVMDSPGLDYDKPEEYL